ncbi:MAG: hypothetical protein PHX24_10820 [Acidithiobacillus sp.]|nr:hypothetical protein [Acidithiobacillus sp.]
MRTISDLENMIHGEAKVRIGLKSGIGVASISAWPFPKVIYMHPNWLDKGEATDAEVKDCLLRQLAMRKDWLFTAITLLATAGLFWMLAAGLWNIYVAPILNANLGTELPINKMWIAYGAAVMVAGVLMRLILNPVLKHRADYFRKKTCALGRSNAVIPIRPRPRN